MIEMKEMAVRVAEPSFSPRDPEDIICNTHIEQEIIKSEDLRNPPGH